MIFFYIFPSSLVKMGPPEVGEKQCMEKEKKKVSINNGQLCLWKPPCMEHTNRVDSKDFWSTPSVSSRFLLYLQNTFLVLHEWIRSFNIFYVYFSFCKTNCYYFTGLTGHLFWVIIINCLLNFLCFHCWTIALLFYRNLK